MTSRVFAILSVHCTNCITNAITYYEFIVLFRNIKQLEDYENDSDSYSYLIDSLEQKLAIRNSFVSGNIYRISPIIQYTNQDIVFDLDVTAF